MVPSFSVNGRRASGGRSCGASGRRSSGGVRRATSSRCLGDSSSIDWIVRQLADLGQQLQLALLLGRVAGQHVVDRQDVADQVPRAGVARADRVADLLDLLDADPRAPPSGCASARAAAFRLSSICLRSGSRAMSARSLRKSYSNGARAKCWKPNSAATVNAALATSSVRGRAAISARDRPQRQRHRGRRVRRARRPPTPSATPAAA